VDFTNTLKRNIVI